MSPFKAYIYQNMINHWIKVIWQSSFISRYEHRTKHSNNFHVILFSLHAVLGVIRKTFFVYPCLSMPGWFAKAMDRRNAWELHIWGTRTTHSPRRVGLAPLEYLLLSRSRQQGLLAISQALSQEACSNLVIGGSQTIILFFFVIKNGGWGGVSRSLCFSCHIRNKEMKFKQK